MKMQGHHGPEAPIPGLPGATLGDFWSWAYSNLLENTVRPVFAEFIVGVLLGVESDGRKVWDAVDLDWGDAKIEVKSSAYVQAWAAPDKGRSAVRYDIARKLPWHADTNITGSEQVRSADCYVFCLYPEQDETQASPINVAAWRFWVLSTGHIDATFGDQKTVALSRIQALTEAVDAQHLRSAVIKALTTESTDKSTRHE
jgi:hypothetical protein